MKPTVGRIVHYVSYGTPGGEFTTECRAAIIARVGFVDADLDLVVFNPTGLFFNACLQNEAEHKGGTWHWPERESVPATATPSEMVPMASQDPLENPESVLTRDTTKEEGPHA